MRISKRSKQLKQDYINQSNLRKLVLQSLKSANNICPDSDGGFQLSFYSRVTGSDLADEFDGVVVYLSTIVVITLVAEKGGDARNPNN